MISREKINQMSRDEQIKEEKTRAAKFGQAPKYPISYAPKFRAKRRTSIEFSAESTILPSREEAIANDLDFRVSALRSVVTGSAIPIKSIIPIDPKAIRVCIMAEIKNLNPENREQILARVIEQFSILALHTDDTRLIRSVQKEISNANFGSRAFKDIPNRYGGARPPGK